jgi:hypothetical protein
MTARKTAAIGNILVAVIGLGAVGVLINLPFSDPLQVPPPAERPGEDQEPIIKNGLSACAEAIYWQDFMPIIPAEGPPFYTIIRINVTNTGNVTVTNFHAVRVTIYFYNTSLPLVTLDVMSSIQYFVWPEIKPGDSADFEYTNVRDSIFSPVIEEGAVLYSRVLTRWENGSEMILTTPPSPLEYTF